MTASNACGSGEARDDDGLDLIPLWSDEMFRVVHSYTWKYANRWYIEHDDVKQDACVEVLRWAAKHGCAEATRRMLATVCRRVGYRTWEKTHRRDDCIPLVPEADRPAFAADDGLRLDVAEAVERLTPKLRDAIESRYWRGESFDEVASRAAVRRASAVDRVAYAYAKMRASLAGGYGPSESRTRAGPIRRRANPRPGRKVDWTTWGPIPNQKEDDQV